MEVELVVRGDVPPEYVVAGRVTPPVPGDAKIRVHEDWVRGRLRNVRVASIIDVPAEGGVPQT